MQRWLQSTTGGAVWWGQCWGLRPLGCTGCGLPRSSIQRGLTGRVAPLLALWPGGLWGAGRGEQASFQSQRSPSALCRPCSLPSPLSSTSDPHLPASWQRELPNLRKWKLRCGRGLERGRVASDNVMCLVVTRAPSPTSWGTTALSHLFLCSPWLQPCTGLLCCLLGSPPSRSFTAEH